MSENDEQLTLYELNQAGYTSIAPLSEEEIVDAIDRINNALAAATYHALICHEHRHFTLFRNHSHLGDNTPILTDSDSSLGNAVIDCVKSLGTPVDVTWSEQSQCFECWFHCEKDSSSGCAMLFPYDSAVIDIVGG